MFLNTTPPAGFRGGACLVRVRRPLKAPPPGTAPPPRWLAVWGNPYGQGGKMTLSILHCTIKYTEKFTLVKKLNFILNFTTSLLFYKSSTSPSVLLKLIFFIFFILFFWGDDQEHPWPLGARALLRGEGRGQGRHTPSPPPSFPTSTSPHRRLNMSKGGAHCPTLVAVDAGVVPI
jgi:hypothetical protein